MAFDWSLNDNKFNTLCNYCFVFLATSSSNTLLLPEGGGNAPISCLSVAIKLTKQNNTTVK